MGVGDPSHEFISSTLEMPLYFVVKYCFDIIYVFLNGLHCYW